jgi:hypothetical protein
VLNESASLFQYAPDRSPAFCFFALCVCCVLCCAVQVNGDPYGAGWMIKVKLANKGELNDLLSAADYEKKCEH